MAIQGKAQICNLDLEEKGTGLKYPLIHFNMRGAVGAVISQSPHRCTGKVPPGTPGIPENGLRTQRRPSEANLFSLRGLALAVMFGGAGPLLAQQRGHLLCVSILHGLQQPVIILVPLVGLWSKRETQSQ